MFLDRQSTPSSFLTGRVSFTPNLPTLPTFAIFRHAFCILFLCFERFSFIFVYGFFNTTHMCMILKKCIYTRRFTIHALLLPMKHWISYDFSIQSMLSFIFFYRSVTINCAVECPMGSQHMCRVSIQNHPDTACIKSETAVQRSAFSSAPRIGTVPWRALQSTNLVQHHPEGRNKNMQTDLLPAHKLGSGGVGCDSIRYYCKT